MPNFARTPHAMIYRCDIKRQGASSTEEEGAYEIPGEYEPHLSGVMCFYFYDVRRTTGEREGQRRTSETKYLTVLVPPETDVTERDRIAQVRDRRGRVFISHDLDIVAVQHEVHHKRLVCQERR